MWAGATVYSHGGGGRGKGEKQATAGALGFCLSSAVAELRRNPSTLRWDGGQQARGRGRCGEDEKEGRAGARGKQHETCGAGEDGSRQGRA